MGSCSEREEIVAISDTSKQWMNGISEYSKQKYNAASEYIGPSIARA